MDYNARAGISSRVYLGFIAFVLLVSILRELAFIFVPLSVAVLLFFLFNNIVRRLTQKGIPRPLVLVGVLLFIFVLLILFGLLIYSGSSTFIDRCPYYITKMSANLKQMLTNWKIPWQEVERRLHSFDWSQVLNASQISAIISGTLGSFTQFLGNLVLVLLYLMFMLAAKNIFETRIGRTIEPERVTHICSLVDSIDRKIQRYLWIKTMMSIATALLGGLVLTIGGIDFVIFSSLLIFIFNYIPTFGSIIGTVFPVTIGLMQYGVSARMVIITVSLMAMQFIMGNVVEPQFTGRGLNLSPIFVLLSLIFWGWVWGVVGMMLAVPLTSSLKMIFEDIPSMKLVAAVMSAD